MKRRSRRFTQPQDRKRWISPRERMQRVLVAGRVVGLNSYGEIGRAAGMEWSTLRRGLSSWHLRVSTLQRLCEVLKCSASYLMEVNPK